MGAFSGGNIAGNILPDATGRDLGSPTQLWDAFFQNLYIQNSNSIRIADNFTGVDWGAKVNAADADLGSTAGEIWISQAAGTSAIAANIVLSANHILRFVQGGTYNLGPKSLTLKSGSGVISPYSFPTDQNQLVLAYTGTGSAIVPYDTTALTYNCVIKGISVTGTSAGLYGINLYAAWGWVMEDVNVSGFTQSNGVGIRFYADQGGTYYNKGYRVNVNNCYTGILFDSDTLLHAPNRNSFNSLKVEQGASGVTGINISQGDTINIFDLALNGFTTGIRFNSNSATVIGNLEQGTAGTSTGISFTNASNTAGMGNTFIGSIEGYNTNVNYNQGAGGTGGNLVISQASGPRSAMSGFVARGNANLPPATNDGLYFSSGYNSPSTGRIYTGDGSGFRLEFAKRTGSADTVNAFIDDSGNSSALTVTSTGGIFKGGAVLDLYANGANRLEVSAAATYPFLDNAYDNGLAGNAWKVSTSYENRNPRSNITVANGANADVARGTATFLKLVGPTGVFSISGFSGGADGTILRVYNSVAFAWTITNNATSTAANRILTLTGADVVLRSGQSAATFQYDSAQSLWILISQNG